MQEERTIIEVGGHKFEVDLAAARRIEEFLDNLGLAVVPKESVVRG